jgi:hypothetical protein
VFAVLVVLAWRNVPTCTRQASFLAFVIGYGLLWFQTLADPGHVMEWFFD